MDKKRIITVLAVFLIAFIAIGWTNAIKDNGMYGECVLDSSTTTKVDVLWESIVDVRRATHVMAVLYTTGMSSGDAIFDIYTSHDGATWTDLETIKDTTGFISAYEVTGNGTKTVMFPADGCYHWLKFRVRDYATDGKHQVFLTATE